MEQIDRYASELGTAAGGVMGQVLNAPDSLPGYPEELKRMPEHRWSGWPGAWCLDCGQGDPREEWLGDVPLEVLLPMVRECPCPGSGAHDPYGRRADGRE